MTQQETLKQIFKALGNELGKFGRTSKLTGINVNKLKDLALLDKQLSEKDFEKLRIGLESIK